MRIHRRLEHQEMWPAEDVAFLRTYSGIEYAQEIAAAFSIRPLFDWTRREAERKLRAAPRIELRFRSVTEVLSRFRDRGTKQVLELAAGLSPRGLILTARDPELVYLETDLPEQIAQKQKCVESILRSRNAARPNLRFLRSDLLDDSEMAALAAQMQGPVAVVSEGIRPLMTAVAPKIYKLLTGCGGVWVTPDLVTRREPRRFHRRRKRPFAFENEAGIDAFLSEAGFRRERYRQLDLIPLEQLESIGHPQLSLDPGQEEAWLTGRGVYCLYPK